MPITIRVNLKNLPVFLVRLTLNLIAVGLVGFALYEFVDAARGDAIAKIIAILIGAACGMGAGAIWIVLYLGDLSEKFIGFLLAGGKHLKKAPPTYGRLEGLIAQHKFDDAENELRRLNATSAATDARFARVVLEFYADARRDPGAAWQFGAEFFERLPPAVPEDTLACLLLLDDLSHDLGVEAAARRLLSAEWQWRRLPEHELAALARRLGRS